ncbi:hypothetical protein GL4_1740 [Methyloceanibacter caenitepidi]|uniref:Uncharacterized protein n=1 Tax=Methyloceanibacter caenitepidi TaxID=1384459 RepID=A0A0A8K5B3_9HYPH|nr:hypothetical protein GL4_1740 [Methyloceanibacter caenitepidi]
MGQDRHGGGDRIGSAVLRKDAVFFCLTRGLRWHAVNGPRHCQVRFA